MANRLASATSPYLLQHAENPVDWWEWGPDAFAEARRRDVPIFLSIGYAACHWCHVMAHESFEDPAIAEQLAHGFVSVKVDREERPDVDAVYMLATQAMTGHGGWPMTCFLTPDLEPFFTGTYFPPEPRHGSPSFGQVLDAVSEAWEQRRDDVVGSARRITERLRAASEPNPLVGGTDPDLDAVTRSAVHALLSQEDRRNGGFGGAPKFPPSTTLLHLLDHHGRTGDEDALGLAARTLEAMGRGGIHDQIGGGFARYAVDAGWVVPHFEKMLYDNALLLLAYARWWRATGVDLAERVVRGIVRFLLDDLRTPEGGFASSLDADTIIDGRGIEGATYVWTPGELAAALGSVDGAWTATVFGVTPEGTFEGGASTLQLRADPDDPVRFDRVVMALRDARRRRPQPSRDDKVVTAWNGLAIRALAEAGALFDEPTWVAAAEASARLLVAVHLQPGGLVRSSRAGAPASAPGVLEDSALLASGLLTLTQVVGEGPWLAVAADLLDRALIDFRDSEGTWFDARRDAADLVVRPREVADGPTPAASAAVADALLTGAALTGSDAWRAAAQEAVRPLLAIAARAPRAAGAALSVAEALLAGPHEVAIIGATDDPALLVLRQVVLRAGSPGLVLASGDGSTADVPLLRGRIAAGGKTTAYVCRAFVCDAPTTDPAELERQLRADTPPG